MTEIATEPYIVDGEGVTIDLILWRRFRAPAAGVLGQLVALPENQPLERAPSELPPGTVVWLPTAAPQQRGTVAASLWD